MSTSTNRESRLGRRPVGMPSEGNFELVQVPIPEPDEGQVLVRNIYVSVDPYMRGRMSARKQYTPPFQIGDYVLGQQGWREYYTSSGDQLTKDISTRHCTI